MIASENVTGADDGPGLVAAAGGRLSGVTAHGLPVASQAPTPTSPARDAGLEVPTSPMPGATSAHWSQAPVVSAPGAAAAPSTPWSQVPVVPGMTEACLACHGSGVVQPRTNMRLFRLIGSGQLRLHAPATPLPATPAPAERPGNGREVSPDLSADSG